MKIIGHNKILKLFDKAIAKNSVSHAYLFSGPEHTGKFTVALQFAQKLSASAENVNPNLIVIAPEIEEKKGVTKKRDIKIEQIRDLQHQLNLSAQGDGYQVAIIDEADRLNKTAQNALLKTLEEASEKVVLILVTQNEKKMLPTILSRCQKIKFGTVPDEELSQYILAGDDKNEVLFWALGCPGLMIELTQNKAELDLRREAEAELKKMFAQNAVDKFAIAESLAKDTGLAIRKLNFWILILREAVLGRSLAIRVAGAKALRLIDRIGKSLDLMKETNSNTRLILENIFLDF